MSLAADYAATPYWLDDAELPAAAEGPLPGRVDVLVIGAGYTGLAAARETARAGRSTLVIDAGPVGGGCSSRNGGQVAFSIKPEIAELDARYGAGIGERIYREGVEALEALRALARSPGGDCDWREDGCFYGAHTRRHYAALVRLADNQPRGFEVPIRVVPKEQLASEIDGDYYQGGLVYPQDAAVHPVKLLNVLHARACAAGAQVQGHAAALAISRDRDGFAVRTARGDVHARQLLLATNGYTGTFSPWHRRRVVPIGSYIIATELLDPALVRRLIPHRRNVVDTRRVVIYARPSPDGRRILFGGRAAAGERDVTRCVPRLHAMMTSVFPALAAARISRAWMGFVAFTFDTLPHLGEADGLHYSMGYCGQGVPLAPYYGRKVGLRMIGDPEGDTALAGLVFPSRPFYGGWPWFLPAAVLGYRLRDAVGW